MRWKVDDEKDEKVGTTILATQWNFPFPITPATGISTATTQHPQCLQCMCQIQPPLNILKSNLPLRKAGKAPVKSTEF